jgi:hypothetical protein
MVEQKDLGREGIDAVDDTIILLGLKQLNKALVAQVFVEGGDLAVGVDVVQTLPEEVGLRLPHGGMEGDNLAVDIGGGDGVTVNDGHPPHTCPAEHLGGIAPDPAEAYHEDLRRLQAA